MMDVDIVCVGFGPATGGFLATLAPYLQTLETPAQVLCYERADDVSYGVSGVVTRARGIRTSFPDVDLSQIPMASPVTSERVVYLLDPIGASRRPVGLKAADRLLRLGKARQQAYELPYVPEFLQKHDGFLFSIGQFNQWVGQQVMATGMAQIWPGMPVSEAIIEDDRVAGVRLLDPSGQGMEVRAALTVVGDGPVGAVGRQLDAHFGLPQGHHQREWAVGMKMVIDLPETCDLPAGTVIHTLGFPEPEIFGFFYVHPDRVATAGIFIPSWFRNPVRTSYRYLQHFLQHPYLWQYVEGGRLRSWGAKSLQESGRLGEPFLAGNGYARIGEGSGSTNVLAGSGVDEAWTTGTQLAGGVIELMREGAPFTRENLEKAYVTWRRASWVEAEGRIAEHARDGFQAGMMRGLLGMALAGFSGGRVAVPAEPRLMPSLDEYFAGVIPAAELEQIRQDCRVRGANLHDALMDRVGWPPIQYDGQLLMSQQDALLLGGKVQASPGYPDHVRFEFPDFCERCAAQLCVEMCSAQAIAPGPGGIPVFDREKCVFCGACFWNCTQSFDDDPTRTNITFGTGVGGLHSAEN